MHIAKLIASATLIVAPISIVSAQVGSPADSGSSNGHRGEWIAGTGAALGAGLFMAFAHSSHNGSSQPGFTFHDTGTQTLTTTPDPSPNGNSTPSDSSRPNTAGTSPDNGTPTPPTTGSDTTTATTATNPPSDPTTGGNPPSDPAPDGNPPAASGPTDDTAPSAPDTSTVPEPSSVALIATGIIGLAPLVRRRRR